MLVRGVVVVLWAGGIAFQFIFALPRKIALDFFQFLGSARERV